MGGGVDGGTKSSMFYLFRLMNLSAAEEFLPMRGNFGEACRERVCCVQLSSICSSWSLFTLLWGFFFCPPLFSDACLTSSLRPSPVFFFSPVRNLFCSFFFFFFYFKCPRAGGLQPGSCAGAAAAPVGVFHYHFQPSLLFCGPVSICFCSLAAAPLPEAPESRLAPQGRAAARGMDDRLASSRVWM